MRKFEIGKTYVAGDAYCSNLNEKFEVIKRTAKTLTIKSELGYSLTKRIIIENNYEKVMVGYAASIHA